MGPKGNHSVLIREAKGENTVTREGPGGRERFGDADLGDWSDAATSQRTVAATRARRGKGGPSLGPPEGHGPANTLISVQS